MSERGLKIRVREAQTDDIPIVSDILLEAAHWLEARGDPLWRDDELVPTQLERDLLLGSYVLGELSSIPVATMRFQLDDRLVWPDMTDGDSGCVHRMAVRRACAGGAVSAALMSWAVERMRALGRPYLRIDCDGGRPRLRNVYERFGFRHHSDTQVGPYFVARYEYRV